MITQGIKICFRYKGSLYTYSTNSNGPKIQRFLPNELQKSE